MLAHKRALGIGYVREEHFLREFGQLTAGWPDAVVSDAVVRHYLAGRSDGARPNRLTVVRALAIFLSLEPAAGPSSRRHGFWESGGTLLLMRVLARVTPGGFWPRATRCPTRSRRLTATPTRHGVADAPPHGSSGAGGRLLALRDQDVNLAAQVVTIRCGKLRKGAVRPIADELVERLRASVARWWAAAAIARRATPSFQVRTGVTR